MILAIDPGNEKTGLAILSPEGELQLKKIVPTKQLRIELENGIEYTNITDIVCGDGTNHKKIYALLQRIATTMDSRTTLINEAHSTEEARVRYWKYNKPSGWKKLVPTGMLYPPEPIDDFTAWIIGERFLKQ